MAPASKARANRGMPGGCGTFVWRQRSANEAKAYADRAKARCQANESKAIALTVSRPRGDCSFSGRKPALRLGGNPRGEVTRRVQLSRAATLTSSKPPATPTQRPIVANV